MVESGSLARGASYALAMGICGWLVVSVGVMYGGLAEGTGLPSTTAQSGSVFLSRSLAMIAATLLGPTLYQGFEDDAKLLVALLLIAAVMMASVLVENELVLHLWFACTGLLHAATDVGTQILTRRTFGKEAGPWLAFNLFAFSLFCVFASTIYFLPSLWLQGLVSALLALAAAVCILGVRLFVGSAAPADVQGPAETSNSLIRWEMKWEGLEVDWLLMTVVFWAIAGQAAIAMYIYVYVDETHQVSEFEVGWLMFLFWVLIAFSRLVTFFQTLLWEGQPAISDTTFVAAIGACSTLGTLFALVWALGPSDSPNCMRIGLLGYALFYAPIPSCAYILSNRLGARTDQTAAMSILGLNLGAGLGPWLCAVVFELAGPVALPAVAVVCSVMPGLTMVGVSHFAADKSKRYGEVK
mmetsp:Transcript_27203/g.55493  ORF Transcript_27203/g.55493 Transcript_27203/m.55493 type:complete len:412 (-) Transcript_27203:160-1395(-)|eukprot:CAMPEP_0181287992 /NCGR_PEP_ID=MMETSP1101-20121128/89_1 /TAXON_ID=46948 /ORGANISM="Rhodomonas abbreviata, Strain Caron Lab Isolate" /LENGTH=411 /DNA_ID=CAMNT_0023392073 /DNA_START=170 /DNA_END=1405 /DNA_ORIENTATION=-